MWRILLRMHSSPFGVSLYILSSPFGVSLYILMILVGGWLPCIKSSICMSRCSMISDLRVSVKSFLGL